MAKVVLRESCPVTANFFNSRSVLASAPGPSREQTLARFWSFGITVKECPILAVWQWSWVLIHDLLRIGGRDNPSSVGGTVPLVCEGCKIASVTSRRSWNIPAELVDALAWRETNLMHNGTKVPEEGN